MTISAELATKLQKLNETQQTIAWALAEGKTNKATAELANCTPEWVSMLKTRPEHRDFQEILEGLTMSTGIAVASERAQLAKQVIEQLTDETGKLKSKRDALDWLEYAGKVTEGPESSQKVQLSFNEPQPMKDLVGE